MNVVDSSGWLEYLANGINADYFASAIEDTTTLIVPSVSLFEVFKRISSQINERQGLYCLSLMRRGKVIALDIDLSISAVRLSLEYKLPMADSIILATSRSFDATLWTQDEDFAGIAGVQYVSKSK
jgi:predicted nucleic acid-binding protein